MVKIEAQGFFSWVVLNNKDKIVRHALKKEPNLILNQGLDGIAVRTWADSFKVCAVGLDGGSSSPLQTGLINETKRTAAYLDLDDACGASLIEKDFVLKRTFVFPTESLPVVYKEAGFSHSLDGGSNLFSRVLLPSILVGLDERLIIQYELFIRIQNSTPRITNNPVQNLNSSGSLQFQLIGLAGVNSFGETIPFDDANNCNEPSSNAFGFLSTNSNPPSVLGQSTNRSGITLEKPLIVSSYVTGTFTREKILFLDIKEGIKPTWRSCGVGSSLGQSFINTGLVHVFDTNFAKGNGSMFLNFRYSWAAFSRANYSSLYYWLNDESMFLKTNPLLRYFDLSND